MKFVAKIVEIIPIQNEPTLEGRKLYRIVLNSSASENPNAIALLMEYIADEDPVIINPILSIERMGKQGFIFCILDSIDVRMLVNYINFNC